MPRAMAGGAWGGATIWLQAGGQRSSRFLDPVDPDNLHNRGGAFTTAGQITAGSSARDRVTRAGAEAETRFDVPNTAPQDDAGQAQRQRVAQGGGTVSWQRGWSEPDGIAGRRLRPPHQLAPRSQRGRHAHHARRRTAASPASAALASVTHQAGAHVLKAGTEIAAASPDRSASASP